ncbi:MAG: PilZ domain-containing protein [Burkholderiales bacterium]
MMQALPSELRVAAGSHADSAVPLQERPRRPDKKADMAGEKRDRERLPLEGQVKGEVMVFQPMTILDISIGGAQIETAFALQLDSLHDFRLSLGDRSIIVKGRVAHCHIGELTDVTALYRTGVEFVSLTEHARDSIADFVAATKFVRPSPPAVDGVVADDE